MGLTPLAPEASASASSATAARKEKYAAGRSRTDTRDQPHQILSLARLPIPPQRHTKRMKAYSQ